MNKQSLDEGKRSTRSRGTKTPHPAEEEKDEYMPDEDFENELDDMDCMLDD